MKKKKSRRRRTRTARCGERSTVGEAVTFWLEQCREVYGKGNIAIEETEAEGFRCFELSGEKMFRIWVRVVK